MLGFFMRLTYWILICKSGLSGQVWRAGQVKGDDKVRFEWGRCSPLLYSSTFWFFSKRSNRKLYFWIRESIQFGVKWSQNCLLNFSGEKKEMRLSEGKLLQFVSINSKTAISHDLTRQSKTWSTHLTICRNKATSPRRVYCFVATRQNGATSEENNWVKTIRWARIIHNHFHYQHKCTQPATTWRRVEGRQSEAWNEHITDKKTKKLPILTRQADGRTNGLVTVRSRGDKSKILINKNHVIKVGLVWLFDSQKDRN